MTMCNSPKLWLSPTGRGEMWPGLGSDPERYQEGHSAVGHFLDSWDLDEDFAKSIKMQNL